MWFLFFFSTTTLYLHGIFPLMTQSDLQVLTDLRLKGVGGRHNSLVTMLEIKVQRDYHLHEVRKVREIKIC